MTVDSNVASVDLTVPLNTMLSLHRVAVCASLLTPLAMPDCLFRRPRFATPPTPQQNTLLMAAAYRSGDDHNSGSTETPSPTSFRLEGNNPANAAGGSSIGGYNAGGIMMLPPTPAPVEHRSSYISAGAGALEPNDDEHNLRTTCDGCTISKIRCDGGHPCKRCLRRRVDCVYREKK